MSITIQIEASFSLEKDGVDLGRIILNIPGRHNVLNSLAAIGISLEVGIDINDIKSALKNFKGVERRMSKIGKFRNFSIIDDYGHHPTEVSETLKTIRPHTKHLIVIFQPHRYSRTLEHYQAFASALSIADKLYLSSIYPAGEAPIENVSSEMILNEAKQINKNLPCFICDNQQELFDLIMQNEISAPSDDAVIITMGAGDIYKLGKKLASVEFNDFLTCQIGQQYQTQSSAIAYSL